MRYLLAVYSNGYLVNKFEYDILQDAMSSYRQLKGQAIEHCRGGEKVDILLYDGMNSIRDFITNVDEQVARETIDGETVVTNL